MGNGLNYIREIMQMNLPDDLNEKFVGKYNFIGHIQDGYIVALTSPFVALSEDNGDAKNYTRKRKATAGDVIAYEHELYAWCTEMGDRGRYPYGGVWLKFVPGPCTQYTGPIPKKEVKMEYNKIPYGFMKIKNVVFNNPATIIMWQDGTKTVVKCGENEEFDPEKGLTMAIAKKAFGNQGNYYNQIRKWLPKSEEGPVVHVDGGSILDTIRRVNNHIAGVSKSIHVDKCKRRLEWLQTLIVDMTFNGATKAELKRAITHSKDLIDAIKGEDVDVMTSARDCGIAELEAKYQPK